MRPFVFFFTFFTFFSAAALVAARTETISGQDRQKINFDGQWRDIDAGESTFTYLRHGSGKASLRVFNASSIAVTVMAENPEDTVRISLDNEDHVVSNTTFQQPAWSGSLDPNVPHTIAVTKQNPDGRYTAIYSFLVTYPDLPANTTQTTAEAAPTPTIPNTSTETETSTTQPEGQTGLTSTTKVVIAGSLGGAVCLGLLGSVLGIYIRRKRNTYAATLDPFSKSEGGTDSVPEGQPNEGEDSAAFPLEDPPPGSPSDTLSAPPPYAP